MLTRISTETNRNEQEENVAGDEPQGIPQIERAIKYIVLGMFVGCIIAVLYGLQASTWVEFASVVAVALLIAGAFSLLGGLSGFLFGIPRTLQENRPTEPMQGENNENVNRKRQQEISYQMNTNLEQISDWLTKILVGVGLTQLSALPDALQKYADFAATGLGNYPSSKVFSLALLVYFLVCGFLLGYLWTRAYFAGALAQADYAAIGRKLNKVERKVSDFQRQLGIDADAWNIVQRQLNPAPNTPPIPQEEINAAIKPASANMKAQIFYLAQEVRSENWRDLQTKPKMERTIPVFKALIASDVEDVYHANHGQLGFALKDKRRPTQTDWTEAEAELSKAIELRGPWQEKGWLFYEFNRAICRIKLDSAFDQGKATDENTKQNIIADLEAVATSSELFDLLLGDPSVSRWMELNNIPSVPI